MLISNIVTISLLKFPIDTKLYELFNVLLHIKAFDRKDKIPSYLTTNILKLSAAIQYTVNTFENKIFVDLNLLFRTT